MSQYVHGYSEREAERLSDQSNILEELLHAGTQYDPGQRVLEAGCGVGAQTEILTRRSPDAHFTSIDISADSLAKARARVTGRTNVEFARADIMRLSFEDSAFDHVFVCFVLEHLANPAAALQELKRVLRPGGSITVIEGDHGSCFWHPETFDSLTVWRCLIRCQQQLGHDPLIGRRLHPLLCAAGLAAVHTEPRWLYADAADPERLDGMVNKIIVPMVETSRERALGEKMTDGNTWHRGIAELSASGQPPEGTFFYTWFKGVGVKPR